MSNAAFFGSPDTGRLAPPPTCFRSSLVEILMPPLNLQPFDETGAVGPKTSLTGIQYLLCARHDNFSIISFIIPTRERRARNLARIPVDVISGESYAYVNRGWEIRAKSIFWETIYTLCTKLCIICKASIYLTALYNGHYSQYNYSEAV